MSPLSSPGGAEEEEEEEGGESVLNDCILLEVQLISSEIHCLQALNRL